MMINRIAGVSRRLRHHLALSNCNRTVQQVNRAASTWSNLKKSIEDKEKEAEHRRAQQEFVNQQQQYLRQQESGGNQQQSGQQQGNQQNEGPKRGFREFFSSLSRWFPLLLIMGGLHLAKNAQRDSSIEDDMDATDIAMKKLQGPDSNFGKQKFVVKLDRINDKLIEYKASMIEAADGKSLSKKFLKSYTLTKKFGGNLDNLTSEQIDAIVAIEKKYKDKIQALNNLEKQEYSLLRMKLWSTIVHEELADDLDLKAAAIRSSAQLAQLESEDASLSKNHLKNIAILQEQIAKLRKIRADSVVYEGISNNYKEFVPIQSEISKIEKDKEKFCLDYFLEVLNILTPAQRETLIRYFQRDVTVDGPTPREGQVDMLPFDPDVLGVVSTITTSIAVDKIMTALMSPFSLVEHLVVNKKPRAFVVSFNGDSRATQNIRFREEVTSILANANGKRGDTVIIVLDSPGGTVTGYGLAAAQIQRLRDAGLQVIACVDQVAASGGYMMASVANKIIASPFAMLGSIGVIATIPNFAERMGREGIAMEEVTAGKFKRTLTSYRKPTPEDRAKVQEDINVIHEMFKSHIKAHRPQVDIEKVATGEVWQGPEALKRKLCDELGTSDDIIFQHVLDGFDVFTVQLKAKRQVIPGPFGGMEAFAGGMVDRFANSVVTAVQTALENALTKIIKGGVLGNQDVNLGQLPMQSDVSKYNLDMSSRPVALGPMAHLLDMNNADSVDMAMSGVDEPHKRYWALSDVDSSRYR